MTTLHYTQVLLASGWADNVRISIDEIGSISKIETGIAGGNSGCLLPESPTYIPTPTNAPWQV